MLLTPKTQKLSHHENERFNHVYDISRLAMKHDTVQEKAFCVLPLIQTIIPLSKLIKSLSS